MGKEEERAENRGMVNGLIFAGWLAVFALWYAEVIGGWFAIAALVALFIVGSKNNGGQSRR